MSKTNTQSPNKYQNLQIFTIELCPSCNFKTKRPFELGDYVFKEMEECAHCKKEKTQIEMIYAEKIKKK